MLIQTRRKCQEFATEVSTLFRIHITLGKLFSLQSTHQNTTVKPILWWDSTPTTWQKWRNSEKLLLIPIKKEAQRVCHTEWYCCLSIFFESITATMQFLLSSSFTVSILLPYTSKNFWVNQTAQWNSPEVPNLTEKFCQPISKCLIEMLLKSTSKKCDQGAKEVLSGTSS